MLVGIKKMLTEDIKKKLNDNNIQLLYILTERFVENIRREYNDKDPEVILDIGSRDLDQSIELRSAFPNSKIIAIEPNPDQYRLCYERSKLFDIDFVSCAISDEEGESDFWVIDFNEGGSSLLKPINVPWSPNTYRQVKVPCRRVDSILKEFGVDKVDCVWMDVQGYELKALKSFGDYLTGVKVIQCEASPNPNYEGHVAISDLEQFLVKNNFELDFLPSPGHPYGEGDIICIKKNEMSSFTNICNLIYDNAHEIIKIKPINIALIGPCLYPDYLKRYFNNAQVHHLDIDLSGEESIDSSLESSGVYYDIILDTKSTDYWDQIRLIRNSVRHLSPGGILIIQNMIKSCIERYSFDVWEYMHDAYFFHEKFQNDAFVLIRNNLKYGKYWGKSKNTFVKKEIYAD